jgi:hypothetical protein
MLLMSRSRYLDLDLRLRSMVEMSLSANLRQTSVEKQRLLWHVENETAPTRAVPGGGGAAATDQAQGFTVTLSPRQIKTFLLNAQPLDPVIT